MTDIRNLYVVQANELIRQTNWAMNKVPLKLLKALVACIDTNSPPENNTITVRKSQFVRLLDENKTNYDYLKQKMKELITAVKIEDDDNHQIFVSLVNRIDWEKNTDNVSVTFSPELMPFLIVSSKFLKYSAELIPQFKSKYGLILFENLYSKAMQYGYGTYIMTVDEIRWITGTVKSYKNFDNFDQRVLKTALKDINSMNSPILVDYEKIKTGRKVTAIKFKTRPRTSYREHYFEIVERPEWLERERFKD